MNSRIEWFDPRNRRNMTSSSLWLPNPELFWRRHIPLTKNKDDKEENRRRLADFVCLANGVYSNTDYIESVKRVLKRRVENCPDGCFPEYVTTERCRPGMGSPSVFENCGLALDSVYGFPILPGPSIKGLLRHYLAEDEDAPAPPNLAVDTNSSLTLDTMERADAAAWLFGTNGDRQNEDDEQTTDDSAMEGFFQGLVKNNHEGLVSFHDAWPIPADKKNHWLTMGIITPHHKDYYDGKKQVPDDREDPTPVHFITVAMGVKFQFAFSLSWIGRNLAGKQQAEVVHYISSLLEKVLDYRGAGGRTSAGYGRMLPVTIKQP